jgi:hypothetical protein
MRLCFVTIGIQIGILSIATSVTAQTLIPVSAKFRPPQHLSFSGRWTCLDGGAKAELRVGHSGLWPWRNTRSAGNRWEPVVETQDGYTVRLLVGYDRDRNEFLTVDADDPAYVAYRPDIWRGTTMTATSIPIPDSTMPTHRFIYTVKNSRQFTVTWERLEESGWETHDSYTCTKKRH